MISPQFYPKISNLNPEIGTLILEMIYSNATVAMKMNLNEIVNYIDCFENDARLTR